MPESWSELQLSARPHRRRALASCPPLAFDMAGEGRGIQEASMSVRGREFVDHWVFENINASPEGNASEARTKAEELVAVAQAQGVSKHEMEEEVGDLAGYLSGAMEWAADAEVARLAAKDD
jgi:hypothetical protein